MSTRHAHLPPDKRDLLRRAVRLQWVSIGVMAVVIAAVGLVAGSSQAMRTAFVEDMLALLPPAVFLIGVWRTRRSRDASHPYGHHRAVGAGHLVASAALLVLGTSLVWNGASGLLTGERPPIGVTSVAGFTFWSGWLMIVVMALGMVPPIILGRLKLKYAEPLHDKVLTADADMLKADWMTGLATIAGVTGIGLGWWWADSAAAILVALSILADGVTNLRQAVRDLLDGRATPVDSDDPDPANEDLWRIASHTPWVSDAAVRLRDMGHVFHGEVFVVPIGDPTLAEVEELTERLRDCDWKTRDTVVVLTSEIPADIAGRDQSSTSGTKT